MARSSASVTTAEPVEDFHDRTTFTLPIAPGYDATLSYKVERTADQIVHHEIVRTRDGELIYDQAVPVDYSVGSGMRGRSYLIRHDHTLYMSPITWYSHGKKWDMSPGYVTANRHFERRIVDGCLNCHVGRAVPDSSGPNRFAENPLAEESIGCERCHGPGRVHVAFHRQEIAQETEPIVNPGKLPLRLRESVCWQCHLQGIDRVLRRGCSEFDFEPGQDFSEFWTVFVKGTQVENDSTTAAVSQVEQMHASRCFRSSGGKLGCISCHDPHTTPEPANRAEYYRSQCQSCHQAPQTTCALPSAERLRQQPNDSCIECHMPRLHANDVPHTTQTDHRILRQPQRTANSSQDSQHIEVFDAANDPTPREDVERARAILMVRLAERDRDLVLAQEGARHLEIRNRAVPQDLAVLESLGSAYMLLRKGFQAQQYWEQVLDLEPNHELALWQMTVLHHDAGLLPEGIAWARRLVELNPWEHAYHGRLAHMLGEQRNFSDGIAAARRAVELSPSAYQIHGWLAEAAQAVDNPDLHAHHRDLYFKLKPIKEPTRR